MKRIGILGGTFNPVHIGHLAIAQRARENLGLDKVFFVPSNLPPHKSSKNVLPSAQRYHMVQMAIEGNPYFDISDFEINREGRSYSIDTVEHFYNLYLGKAKLYFIIGEDSFAKLDTWKHIDNIVKLADFVVVNRPGINVEDSKIKVRTIEMPGLDISSSSVRRCLRLGKTVKYFLPEKVLEYIKRKKLYV
ncbi:MAG: nicotinate (nicotinamide) nucleotide adenylyltransferase [Omnitrophica WOR_2 bacterium RIFOXYB2_FULL_38_16]|nr:MAG: nicotinate (nicotinamide) nucleotide adenylyltransferase [Omnitrophica WOR_2 bacterium RIFOXYA2_FULL_38_17]OGX60228.1 MAG: nicotinate (nicotinamide) nucleotide adenylyltransferase [Omnitrophica WOR_2 bacterium RIFOXYB2_FULL_38_16]